MRRHANPSLSAGPLVPIELPLGRWTAVQRTPWPLSSPVGSDGASMKRAAILVLDSFGIGGAEDAAAFGDAGADTLGHIAAACADGRGDAEGVRSGPLRLPNLARLGLAAAA